MKTENIFGNSPANRGRTRKQIRYLKVFVIAVALLIGLPITSNALPSQTLDLPEISTTIKYLVGKKSPETRQRISAWSPENMPNQKQIFSRVFNGFAADLTPLEAEELRNSGVFDFVEPDFKVKIAADVSEIDPFEEIQGEEVISNDDQISDEITSCNINYSQTGKPCPPWNLDRIDQNKTELDGIYQPLGSGNGVNVYVIDTGLNRAHQEFNNQVGTGLDLVENDDDPQDCNGHGTHVSATIAGKTKGVAPGARIIPIRALDCNGEGDATDVIAAIELAIAQQVGLGPAVLNLSIIGQASEALDAAITNAINSGLIVVAAAGNGGLNACEFSPGRVPSVLTIGSTDQLDQRLSISNDGSCVDAFAPGDQISSASHASNSGFINLTGTSMASAHWSGGAAIAIQLNPGLDSATISEYLISVATPEIVGNTSAPNRRLLFIPAKMRETQSQSTPVKSQTPTEFAQNTNEKVYLDLGNPSNTGSIGIPINGSPSVSKDVSVIKEVKEMKLTTSSGKVNVTIYVPTKLNGLKAVLSAKGRKSYVAMVSKLGSITFKSKLIKSGNYMVLFFKTKTTGTPLAFIPKLRILLDSK